MASSCFLYMGGRVYSRRSASGITCFQNSYQVVGPVMIGVHGIVIGLALDELPRQEDFLFRNVVLSEGFSYRF